MSLDERQRRKEEYMQEYRYEMQERIYQIIVLNTINDKNGAGMLIKDVANKAHISTRTLRPYISYLLSVNRITRLGGKTGPVIANGYFHSS
jgi:response regulator of citrate/malate metabolism